MQDHEIKLIAIALIIAAGIFLRRLLRPKARIRRHLRKQEQARRVLAKINTIPLMPQRLAYLRKIDPLTFEELLLEAFERRGHTIFRNTHYSGDGGIDGMVEINGETHLLQAKRYAKHINRQHIAAFSAVIAAKNCKGYFIHTGKTGAGAKELASQDPRMIILSGQKLLDFLNTGLIEQERSSIREVPLSSP
ncbi:restriction endonuclease [Agrobacterium pusense]|uniref:Restriction endonuclease n=1 Tax=Agrobacterium pusense TaxID=648995 RepID=A0AA44EG13_9HYPH|nr:restriction endonuclease [Agrobacterium pusense]PZU78352.1 MAG: restriction endonuclease [Rhizobium sp.]MDH0873368.1 restriction endonuclease [Agrobacterium pusense]MDH2092488.1 restriction endonuclease [Agrobacterium pusense]NRF07754.1 restriction endonuclease [Agrobacterium pusense]NRF18051.1 restriction endonuclease [Agrobacterium pusense]